MSKYFRHHITWEHVNRKLKYTCVERSYCPKMMEVHVNHNATEEKDKQIKRKTKLHKIEC